MAYHVHVEMVKEYYLNDFPDDKKAGIAKKLLVPSETVSAKKLETMWRYIQEAKEEQGKLYDELWVQIFIEHAFNASNFPVYYYTNKKDRDDLIGEIETLTANLSKKIKANDLDYHLFCTDGKSFNGFYFYEEFSLEKRKDIDQEGFGKIPLSSILKGFSQTAKKEVLSAMTNAKAGGTVDTTRFIRALFNSIEQYNIKRVNAVLITTVLAIYGKEYESKGITQLLRRSSIK